MNDLNLDQRPPHSQLSSAILGSCFEVMNELGIGFLESVYKNALFFALREKGLFVETEKSFEVYFKRQKVGLYKVDIVVENLVRLGQNTVSEFQLQDIQCFLECDIKPTTI